MNSISRRLRDAPAAVLAVLFILITVFYGIDGYGQTETQGQSVEVRVKNNSKFLITKLVLLGHTFENLKSRDTTAFVKVMPFYPSMRVDVTVKKRRLFHRDISYHFISMPVDHVGERKITNARNTVAIDIVKAEERGQLEVLTEIVQH